MTQPWRASALLFAALLALASCGIPEDNDPRAVTLPTATPVIAAATPTPVLTTNFTIYLTDEEGRVRPAVRELPNPLTVTALIAELLEVPTENETQQGLISRIPPETQLLGDPIAEDGRAQIDFAAGGLDTLEDDLILAIAQVVWTLTESPSISQVVIRIEGVDEQWPTDGDDKLILTRNDYASFDPERVAPTPVPVDEEPPTEEEPTPEPTAEPSGDDG